MANHPSQVPRIPKLYKRRTCIMKAGTVLMYCGKGRGGKKEYQDRVDQVTPASVAKWEPELDTLCVGCVDAYAAELTKEVAATLRQLKHLGKPYKRVAFQPPPPAE